MAELCRYDDGRCRSPQGCADMRRCLAPSTVTCRCARCDTEVILTSVAYDSFKFSSMGILCERHLSAQREPLQHSQAGYERLVVTLDTASEARMIRWLTGTGEFDTNDPCDEWPAP